MGGGDPRWRFVGAVEPELTAAPSRQQGRRVGLDPYVVPLHVDSVPSDPIDLWSEFFRVGNALADGDHSHIDRRRLVRRLDRIATALADRRRRSAA